MVESMTYLEQYKLVEIGSTCIHNTGNSYIKGGNSHFKKNLKSRESEIYCTVCVNVPYYVNL